MNWEPIYHAAKALGIIVRVRQAPTFRVAPECGSFYPHTHSARAMERQVKRAMCTACANYVPVTERSARLPEPEHYTDHGRDEQDWDAYRHDRYRHWMEGCKTGMRPGYAYEQEGDPPPKGKWWDLIKLPCPGFRKGPA
jgi:hypothetical protein